MQISYQKSTLSALVAFFLLFLFSTSLAAELLTSKQLVPLLQKGGYVLYWRHAATEKQEKDAVDVRLDDCSTQRNLSTQGKQQARDIGGHLSRLNIAIDHVVSSPYCRCKQTAMLAFDRVVVDSALYFSIDVDKKNRNIQTKKLRQLLSSLPTKGKNNIIVSHTANLKEAADIWPKPEAVIHVFMPTAGGFSHLGKILPDQWQHIK